MAATGDGAASALFVAAGGVDEGPEVSGLELSGDWGALDSSAMDPGTIGLHKMLTTSQANPELTLAENAANGLRERNQRTRAN